MSWLVDLVVLLVTRDTKAEPPRARVDEHDVNEQIERFLQRFEHPAGRASMPVEPSA